MTQTLKPSARGELKITDLNRLHLNQQRLNVEIIGRVYAWLNTGKHDSLLEASQFIATIENMQGLKAACLEEISFNHGWINRTQLEKLAAPILKNQYGQYLQRVLKAES